MENNLQYAGIKNLLFDLGGVIMDIDRDRCARSFVRIGMDEKAVEAMLGLYVQGGSFLQLEEGLIGAQEFYADVRKHFPNEGKDISDDDLKGALCDFLLSIPMHRLAELRELRKKFGIYLLSNTNPIMFDSKIAENFRQEGYEIDDYFDGQVVSYKALCAKPDLKIFRYTAEHLGIKPEETIFFDDSQKNLDAAAKLGFATALVAPGTEFMDVIRKLNLI